MKINDSKSYDKINKSSSPTTEHTKVSAKTSIPKQGDVIKGEIIDLKQTAVTIRLLNGQTIQAKLTDPFEFFIGQELSFVVKESSVEQLLLKPLLEQGTTLTNKLVQALDNAGITVTKENLEIVTKLIEHQMPIDKDTLQKVILYTKQFSSADIDELLFLVKNTIPVTKDNLTQLNKMTLGDNKIIQNLATLSDDLSVIFKEESGQDIAKILLKDNALSQEVFNQIQKQVSKTEPYTKLNTDSNTEQNTVTSDKHEEILHKTLQKNIPLNTVMSDQDLAQLEMEINKSIEVATKSNPDLIGKKMTELNNKTIVELFQMMDELELPLELKNQLTEIFTKKITYDLFKREVLMNQEHLESPEKLNEFYDKLQEKVTSLLALDSSMTDSKSSSISKEAHQVNSAIEFMSDLNQKYNYIQLPMMLNDRLLNAELYVFNNKKQIKNEKTSLTALIRLDLVNLGHLDIYVNKKEQNVSVQFYTENEEKNALIDQKLFSIHNQLTKQGFKVQSISTKKKEKDFDVKDDFLQKKEDIHEVKRFTFDMRA